MTPGCRIGTAAAALLLTPLLPACAADALSDAEATVRDSAGVRIVEHPGTLAETPIALELVWEHGQRADDYAFQYVFLGALQPGGGAIVADGGNAEIVSIGADGVGRGSSPGAERVRGRCAARAS